MKGRTPTAAEREWMDRVAQHGCYCCRRLGIHNDYISLHHTQGRTKPGAHFLVIPLCDRHHEYRFFTGLHNNIGLWRKTWGREEDIVQELFDLYGDPR